MNADRFRNIDFRRMSETGVESQKSLDDYDDTDKNDRSTAKALEESINDFRQLCSYVQMPRKEKSLCNAESLFTALRKLALVLGYEAEINFLLEINIPPELIINDLYSCSKIFEIKHYLRKNSLSFNGQKYVVLLKGTFKKNNRRISMLKDLPTFYQQENQLKNDRKQKRNTLEIKNIDSPLCLNPKKMDEFVNLGAFLTTGSSSVEILQVGVAKWKGFMSVCEDTANSFLKKFVDAHLCVSIRQQKLGLTAEKDGEHILEEKVSEVKVPEVNQSRLPTNRFRLRAGAPEGKPPQIEIKITATNSDNYKQIDEDAERISINQRKNRLMSIQLFDAKTAIKLSQDYLYLLYSGEMFIKNCSYGLRISKGSIVNSNTIKSKLQGLSNCEPLEVESSTNSVVIKIEWRIISAFFEANYEEKRNFSQMIFLVQESRMNRFKQQKAKQLPYNNSIQRKSVYPINEGNKQCSLQKNISLHRLKDQGYLQNILARSKAELLSSRIMNNSTQKEQLDRMREYIKENCVIEQAIKNEQKIYERKIKEARDRKAEDIEKMMLNSLFKKQMELNCHIYQESKMNETEGELVMTSFFEEGKRTKQMITDKQLQKARSNVKKLLQMKMTQEGFQIQRPEKKQNLIPVRIHAGNLVQLKQKLKEIHEKGDEADHHYIPILNERANQCVNEQQIRSERMATKSQSVQREAWEQILSSKRGFGRQPSLMKKIEFGKVRKVPVELLNSPQKVNRRRIYLESFRRTNI